VEVQNFNFFAWISLPLCAYGSRVSCGKNLCSQVCTCFCIWIASFQDCLKLFSCLSLESISILKRCHYSLQSRSVFVKNLNFKTTDESLKQHFSTKIKGGSLKSATVWIIGRALIMDIRCILQHTALSILFVCL
jgi:hypothetical protein